MMALEDKARSAGPADRRKVRTIPIEEACLPAEVFSEWERLLGFHLSNEWKERLSDFGSRRLEEMDRCGIEMSVLSLTVPGPQGERDPATADSMARRGNDALAKAISARPDRYAGFGCLSMHDVDAACREFERAVKELGMRGVLLNNFQLTGDRDRPLFYDQRRFDPFWDTAQRLDVPVYLHPGPTSHGYGPDAGEWGPDLDGVTWLKDAAWAWGAHTGTHALRIITTGVFDRFPGAQLVLGHNGEHIVYDLWRIDNRIRLLPQDCPAKKSVRSYFRTNVQITTSGEFSDPAIRHAIQEIGADRVLFSIDTPYEDSEAGASWFASAPLDEEERRAIARGNAIRLLKLPISV